MTTSPQDKAKAAIKTIGTLREEWEENRNRIEVLKGGALVVPYALRNKIIEDQVDGLCLLRPLAAGTHVLCEVCTSCEGNGQIQSRDAVCCGNATPHGECCNNPFEGQRIDICGDCGGIGIHRHSTDTTPEEHPEALTASQEQE